MLYGHFLLPNASTSWLRFSANETLAVNRAAIKSSGTIQSLERLALSFPPAREIPGSCTHARWLRSKLSLQRALSNLSQHSMMWECSLQSPRCFQSAGFFLILQAVFRVPPLTAANHFRRIKPGQTIPLIIWILRSVNHVLSLYM